MLCSTLQQLKYGDLAKTERRVCFTLYRWLPELEGQWKRFHRESNSIQSLSCILAPYQWYFGGLGGDQGSVVQKHPVYPTGCRAGSYARSCRVSDKLQSIGSYTPGQ